MPRLRRMFNVRPLILRNLQELQQASNRNVTRNQSLVQQRANDGICMDPVKTLDLLRQLVQTTINREIASVLQRYVQNYFDPTIANIKANLSDDRCLDSDHVNLICRQILDDAKQMYPSLSATASACLDVENSGDAGENAGKPLVNKNIPSEFRKSSERADSDVESEISHFSSSSSTEKSAKRHRVLDQDADQPSPSKVALISAADKQPETAPITEVHRFDISRLQAKTLFVLGSRANSALGLGSRRGIYSKHSDLFRYDADAEDKTWLAQKGVQMAGKTKACLMFHDDVQELLHSADYESRPKEIESFTIPEFMLNKVGSRLQTMYENAVKNKLRADRGHSSRSSSRQDTPGSLGHDGDLYH